MHTRTSLFALLTLSTLAACGDDTTAATTGGGGGGGATTATSTGGDGGGGPATTSSASTSSASTSSQGGSAPTSGPGGGDQGGGDQGGGDQGGGGAGGEAPGCPGGLTPCGDGCVDTAVDPGNCGACGEACDPGEICNGQGACALTCQLGFVECDGACIDPSSNNQFCGAGADCAVSPGEACDAGEICNGSGVCEVTCQAGLVVCDGACVDPLSDREHCGAGVDCAASPGEVCDAGELCDGQGVCQLSCQAGLVECGETCVDPESDETFCGAGADCAADPGTTCAAGEICDDGTCTLSCQVGLVACDGVCIDPASNPAHCGAGADCTTDPGEACGAEEACFQGQCVPVVLACDVDPAAWQLPIVLHAANYYGEIAFDGDCNVLVGTSFTGEGILRIDAASGAVSTLATGFGASSFNGVAYREEDGLVYVATDSPNRVWRIVGGAPQTVGDVSQMNAIAIAPAGFGAFGGDIIGVGTDGEVIAVDPATGTSTVIGTQNGILSDLVFAPDGSTLYVASQDGSVRRMTAAGVFTDLATGLQEPDGLAIDATGTRLYVAHYPAGGRIDAISVADGAITAGPAVDLDGGYYTTGLLVDRSGDILLKTSVDGSAVLDVLPPF